VVGTLGVLGLAAGRGLLDFREAWDALPKTSLGLAKNSRPRGNVQRNHTIKRSQGILRRQDTMGKNR